jgi:hypothetical protein
MSVDTALEFVWNPKTENKHYTTHTKPHHFATPEAEREDARKKTKICSKCKVVCPLSYFNGNTSGADPFDSKGYRLRRPECSSCSKKAAAGKNEAAAVARGLGMTTKAPAGTRCEICNSSENIVFDHDHTTKRFRGWACNPCNRSMGVLGDSVEGLLRALNYLNKTSQLPLSVDATGLYVSAGAGAGAGAGGATAS